MRKIWSLFRKELQLYLFSPTSYVAFAFFFLVLGYLFSTAFLGIQRVEERLVYNSMSLLFLFVTPMITMRLLSEELRQGTDELLFTSPVNVLQVVAGKYLASVTVVLFLLAVSLVYPLILTMYGSVDWGKLSAAFLGVFLLASAMMAVGIFASSLSASQMVAGITSFAILLAFWLIQTLSDALYGGSRELFQKFSPIFHLNDFEQGIVDMSHVLYYFVFVFLFLGLSVQSLEKRRWR
ncbi:MAG: ABC-2 transporter permease [Firmicutes bacterium]|uniref:ABC-2 type transport system permease protein n=1 Tax=Melghirimyces thermohalophilus TaxID=1236220 RepID=A0A1G6IAY4_9BACL|nr:ABC-2 transporter permease [Melghirimyces thermohalophilus]MDA8351745.1 ABC-2 transporter permease [Bacillota bacterium]SDC03687.1 ABC-2 type transport system permease protein [Melghirimyces thermohalophilus]